MQEIVAFGLFLLAGGYLLVRVFRAVRGVLQNEKGCASGCGKCAFAVKTPARTPSPSFIPLTMVEKPTADKHPNT